MRAWSVIDLAERTLDKRLTDGLSGLKQQIEWPQVMTSEARWRLAGARGHAPQGACRAASWPTGPT